MALTAAASLHYAAAERILVPDGLIGLKDADFGCDGLEPIHGICLDPNPTKTTRSDGSKVDHDRTAAILWRDEGFGRRAACLMRETAG